jgi:putative DNA methylase
MSEGSQFHRSALRSVLYALMELDRNADGGAVLAHLTLNVPNYYSDLNQRDLVVDLSGYLAKKLETLRPDESANARVLRELVLNQRLA